MQSLVAAAAAVVVVVVLVVAVTVAVAVVLLPPPRLQPLMGGVPRHGSRRAGPLVALVSLQAVRRVLCAMAVDEAQGQARLVLSMVTCCPASSAMAMVPLLAQQQQPPQPRQRRGALYTRQSQHWMGPAPGQGQALLL